MKKIILSALFVLCSAVAMNANDILGIFNVGARVGITSSSEQMPMSGNELTETINAEGTGWTGTIFARINIPKLPLYIQPELQYSKTAIEFPSLDILGKDEEKVESHRYIDMPILLGFEFGLGSLANVKIHAGPVFTIAAEKGFGDLTEDDFVNAYNKHEAISWTAGLGVQVLMLVAEVRYNGNFSGEPFDIKNPIGFIDPNYSNWNLSIGVMF